MGQVRPLSVRAGNVRRAPAGLHPEPLAGIFALVNVHYFQHAESEGPGQIGLWATARGHTLSATRWDLGGHAPDLAAVDFLVVMGGAMNIYEYRACPWLRDEKEAIQAALARGLPVLGICLGAQLIADVLGAKIYQNPEFELGWYPVRMSGAALATPGFTHFPAEFTPFHWHGDTFDLPPGATLLAGSDLCPRQAFASGPRVVGLQFHPEVTAESVRAFIDSEPQGLPSGRYVQTPEQIMAGVSFVGEVHRALEGLMDYLAADA